MTANVLFEIGVEELPSRFIDNAELQLKENTAKWLHELRVPYKSLKTFSTPRRLAVLIQDIAEEQTSFKEEVKGPAEKIARNEDGDWTKAAIGFTKGQGKTTDDIYIKEIKGARYIFVEKFIEGDRTIDLLPAFKTIITSLHFNQTMYWGDLNVKYARPIRWLTALYNDIVIPFELAGVSTSNQTNGHRFLGTNIRLTNPDQYEDKLKENYVIANKDEREKMIIEGINTIEKRYDFHILVTNDLLQEVRNLVEYPTVFVGTFDTDFLELPKEVLITSMKEHQRYFPVESKEHHLLAYFIGVRNGDDYKLETVVKGNEKVLRARLADADFFYEEDRKQTINSYLGKLESVVFQEKLGTLHEKVERITVLTDKLSKWENVESSVAEIANRAAQLCKFDLTTNMVNEFTELQGIMGEKYANYFGEDEAVALAIKEHYAPKQASDPLPSTKAASLVGVADKMDSIVGFISADLTPTGSHDPNGLRRQAIGILRILAEGNWEVTLESIIKEALKPFKKGEEETNIVNNVQSFFKLRARYMLKEQGIEQDVIDAVLHDDIGMIRSMIDKAIILSRKRSDELFKYTQEALVRVLNLAKQSTGRKVDTGLFSTESETTLYHTYLSVEKEYVMNVKKGQVLEAFNEISKLAPSIHEFFEHNMVMTDNEAVKNNRLAIIYLIANLILNYADLTLIQWKQHQ